MPRVDLKPLVKLSNEQWKAVIARVMKREGGVLPEKMSGLAGEATHSMEPEGTDVVGRLLSHSPGGNPIVERLPIAEARAKYMANPDQYQPGAAGPPANEMRFSPASPEQMDPGADPEQLAQNISMRRIQQAPIIPPSVASAQSSMERDYAARGAESSMERAGIDPTSLRPGVDPKQLLAEKGAELQVDMPPAHQRIQAAMVADELWRNMGGGRSIGAKVWERLRSSSRQSSHIKTNRDYFISSFARWREDPSKFGKHYPREANVLGQLWEEFKASLPKADELMGGE